MTPYLIPLVTYWKQIAIALALAAAFGAGFKVEQWRTGAQVERLMTKHAELQLAAANKAKDAETAARASEAKARADEATFNKQLQDAQNAARTREISLRRDADAARRSAGGLRDELAALNRRFAEAPLEAVLVGTSTVGDVLLECTERYRYLAEKADRHASDVKTLSDAWPVR